MMDFAKLAFGERSETHVMLYVSQITENNLCMVNSTLFRFQKYQDCDTATEKWSKREKKVGPDKKVGIYLQKPKTSQKFKAWDRPKSDQNSQYQVPIEVSSVMLSSALPVRLKKENCLYPLSIRVCTGCKAVGYNLFADYCSHARDGQRILRAQSFQTLRGNEWLDSDVNDSGEKLFVSIPSIVVIQTEYCRVFKLRTSCLLKNK